MRAALETGVAPMDIRALHERMGRVYHQPVRVHSFTNKRFTVNFRVPLDELRRIVPEPSNWTRSATPAWESSVCAPATSG
jgi:hypothetical protein